MYVEGVSKSRGAQYRPSYNMVLSIGTPEKWLLVLGTPLPPPYNCDEATKAQHCQPDAYTLFIGNGEMDPFCRPPKIPDNRQVSVVFSIP